MMMMMTYKVIGGTHGVMFIIIGNKLCEPRSNSGEDFAFHFLLIPLRKAQIMSFPPSYR